MVVRVVGVMRVVCVGSATRRLQFSLIHCKYGRHQGEYVADCVSDQKCIAKPGKKNKSLRRMQIGVSRELGEVGILGRCISVPGICEVLGFLNVPALGPPLLE